jgi:hypothetical protein
MRNAAREKSPFRQLEFCFETPVVFPLPSAAALQVRAVSLLLGLGSENLAARLRVDWNDRMRTTVGRADFQRSLILLNLRCKNLAPPKSIGLAPRARAFASTFSLSATDSPARTGMAQSLLRP